MQRETHAATEYPFIIGITGHRDIVPADEGALRVFLSAQFNEIKDVCKDTPIIVLTSLAEGADQLCAEVALESGIDIISVLPMDEFELSKDFSGNALERFNRLCTKSSKIIIAPDMELGKVDPCIANSKSANPSGRSYWYRQAGIYIAQRCHLLIALWDGGKDESGCGTAAIVEHAKREWTNNDRGFAYNPLIEWIKVERSSTENTKNSMLDEGQELNVDNSNELSIKYLGKEIDARECAKIYADKVFELNSSAAISGDAANSLAVDYRDRYNLSNKLIAIGSVLVVLFFMLYEVLEIKWGLIATLVTLATTAILQLRADSKHEDYLDKYIDYRLLAETNRVQDFVSSLGKTYSACDFYTYFLKNSFPWIEQAARARMLVSDVPRYEDEEDVRNVWCKGQHIYHLNVRKRDLPRLKKQKIETIIDLTITIVVYIALTLIEYVIGGSLAWINAFKVLLALGAAISLFVTDYYEKQSLEQKCEDSLKMAELYRKAYEEWLRLDEEKLPKDELIEMLARAEIEELGMWVSHQ